MMNMIVPTAPAVDGEALFAWLAWLVQPQADDPLARPAREREAQRAAVLDRRDAIDLGAPLYRLDERARKAAKREAWDVLGVGPAQRAQAGPLLVARMRRVAVELVEVRLRAERRLGELLPPKPTPTEAGKKGGRGKKAIPIAYGFSPNETKKLRDLAAVPEPVFEHAIAEARERGDVPSVDAASRIAGRAA